MSDEEILAKAYDAFNERNLDAAIALMHPDVVWPNAWEGGTVTGRESVRDYWTRQWAAIDPHVEPTAMRRDARRRVVVTVRAQIRDLDGEVLSESTIEHVYSLEDGLIRTMEIRVPE